MNGQGDGTGDGLASAARRAADGRDHDDDVLVLTAAMRLDDARALPGALPPAEDEEPPLLLTNRIESPQAPGPAADARPAPAFPPAFPTESPVAEPAPDFALEPAANVAPEPPAWSPAPAPQPEPPAWTSGPAGEAPAFPPVSAPDAEPDAAPHAPLSERATSFDQAPAPIDPTPIDPKLAADGPGEGPLRPAAAEPEAAPAHSGPSPREMRAAFADAAPGPVAATGLPRSRDALQEMIKTTLREELGGPLGERISRNIRLLIEQEVKRALAEAAKRDGGQG